MEETFASALEKLTNIVFGKADQAPDESDENIPFNVDTSTRWFELLFKRVADTLDVLLKIFIELELIAKYLDLEEKNWVDETLKDIDGLCQSLREAAKSLSIKLSIHSTFTDGKRLLDSLHDIINEARRSSLIRINDARLLPVKYVAAPKDLAPEEVKQIPPREENAEQTSLFQKQYALTREGEDETEFGQVCDKTLYYAHITISRDQTNSSDFRKDLLVFLRSSKLDRKFRLGQFTGSTPRLLGVSGEQLELYRTQRERIQQTQETQRPDQPREKGQAQAPKQKGALPQPPPPPPPPRPVWRPRPPPPPPPGSVLRALGFKIVPFSRHFFPTDPSFPNMVLAHNLPETSIQEGSSDAYEKFGVVGTLESEPNNNVLNFKPELRSEVATAQDNHALQQLLDRISSLEEENKGLMAVQDSHPSWETLHIIQDDGGPNKVMYLEEPTWALGPRGEFALKAHFPVNDIEGYLRQKQRVAFCIAKFYSATHQQEEVQRAVRDKTPLPRPKPLQESIRFESATMIAAAEEFSRMQPKFATEFPNFDIKSPIPAPYLFWYHYRSSDAFKGLNSSHREHMELLCSWIDKHYGPMYDRVNEQLSRKVVSYETMPFLVKPGDVLVSKHLGKWRAHVATSWSFNRNPKRKPSFIQETTWAPSSTSSESMVTSRWSVDVWSYKYDGRFYRSKNQLEIDLKAGYMQEEVKMEELNIVPLKYANKEAGPMLKKRGESFWSCRNRRLVSYMDESGAYGSVWMNPYTSISSPSPA